MPENLENSTVATGLENVIIIPIPKRDNVKECSNSAQLHSSHTLVKILQARLQQYVNCELPDIQVGFRKGTGIRDQIANIHWVIDKEIEFQKEHLFLLY